MKTDSTSSYVIPPEVSSHAHVWERQPWVIDTAPETYIWTCECGAVTHHKDTGELCVQCTKRQVGP
jgi:hypothetical protein